MTSPASSLKVMDGADYIEGLPAALKSLEASPEARQHPESVKPDERTEVGGIARPAGWRSLSRPARRVPLTFAPAPPK